MVIVCTFRSRQLYRFITRQTLCCWRQGANEKGYLLKVPFHTDLAPFSTGNIQQNLSSQSLLAQRIIQKQRD